MGMKTIIAVNGFWYYCNNTKVNPRERAKKVLDDLYDRGYAYHIELLEHLFFSKEKLPEDILSLLESDYIDAIEKELNKRGYKIEHYETD